MLFTFFQAINEFISDYYFLLTVQSCAFVFKLTLLFFFTAHIFRTKRVSISWYYLLVILICSLLEDFAWIVSLSSRTILPFLKPVLRPFFIRIGWSANILIYQALSLFMESFTKKNYRYFAWYQYIFLPISSIFFFFFLKKAFSFYSEINALEETMQSYQSFYSLIILLPFTILLTLYSLQKTRIPSILHHQLKIVLQYLLIPYLIANLFQMYPLTFLYEKVANNQSAVGISTIFLSLTLYYCIRKIIGLRFLNIHSHVHAHDSNKFNFVNDFKNTLESLGNASSTNEIKLIVQHFFSRAFTIPPTQTFVYVRTMMHTSLHEASEPILINKEIIIENFISAADISTQPIVEALKIMKQSKILIKDEIEYNNYYDQTDGRNTILTFLDSIDADIFIPIYEDGLIIASIVIERNARSGRLYTNIERDEMLVFSSYLSKIIYLLQNRNLNELLKQRKDIREELYLKHQEVNQYKESIRSFLRNNKNNHFGILFYKNRKFSFGNKEASEIISLNPNTQEGDPLSKLLHTMAHQVELYKTTQSTITKDASGKKLVITALPHPEKTSVIFTVHYPEISDIVKQLLDYVKNPSDWDYLLYLETTQSGKLVNELIPGTGEILLNFKIDLLKLALTKKALLLEIPQQDLESTIELIHHLSLRETLYTLDIQSATTGHDIPLKLFGINPLFGSSTSTPLLERLDKKGTLFIKNVHFLDKETQEILAEFIRYGFYRIFKSEKKMQADVRIICSSNQNVSQLVQKGTFSAALYNELCKSSLILPSIMTLPEEELHTLVQGFSEQAIAGHDISSIRMLMLSDKDKERIINQKSISLHELKIRIQNILLYKTKNNEQLKDTQFHPAYNISDPKLIEASRLGKHALKDRNIMNLLWEKFQNQNKIAIFLGVNRSSVNRRCKDFGII